MGKVVCTQCDVRCNSIRSFCEHINGMKHISQLTEIQAENPELLGRMQLILDSYMKLYPVLGLEYVVEEEVNSTYYYICTLCHVEHDMLSMIIHLTDPEHNWGYINRHHPNMGVGVQTNIELMETVKSIYSKYGRKQIRINKPDNRNLAAAAAGPSTSSSEGGKKNAHPPDKTQVPESENLSYYCEICSVSCPCPMVLCKHTLGYKHKQNLQKYAPQMVKTMYRLSFFLSDYLTDEPILGLEHVMEEKQGKKWKYSCKLCSKTQLSLLEIFPHVLDVEHTVKYVRKHHQYLMPANLTSFLWKNQLMKSLRPVALRIVEEHGRKSIQVKDPWGGKPRAFPEAGHKKALKKSAGDGPPLAKKGRLEEDQEASTSQPHASKPTDSQPTESHEEDQEASTSSPQSSKPMDSQPTESQAPLDAMLCHKEDQEASTSGPHTSTTESQAPLDATAAMLCHEEVQEASTSRPHTSTTESQAPLDATATMLCHDENQEASTSGPHTSKPTESQAALDATTAYEEDQEASSSRPQTSKPMDSQQTESQATVEATTATRDDITETSEVSVSKARSPPPDVESALPVDNEDPSSELLPKNNITDFFSSVKDMDESEVVGVFQKIATTKPEFQGMDIPAVMKILKDSDRLKK